MQSNIINKLFNIFKKTFTPPYNQKDIPLIAFTVVILTALVVMIALLQKDRKNNLILAQTPNNYAELEDGTVGGDVAVLNDSNASGGRYVVFQNAIPSPSPTPESTPTPYIFSLEPPPDMAQNNSVTFSDVCPEDTNWPSSSQMAGKDVKIVLPKTRACAGRGNMGGTKTSPARNIWLVGGKLDYSGPRSTESGTAGFTLVNWTGTVFIEGTEIDLNNTCNDVIRGSTAVTNGQNRRVVIQNSYLHGAGYCTPVGTHGDLFHAQNQDDTPVDSKIAELKMQNVRGGVINQGIFVPFRPQNSHGVRKFILNRVEIVLDPEFKFENNKVSTMVYADPTGGDGNDYPPDGQDYRETYLNWWDPWYPGSENRLNITLPSPSSYDGSGCAIFTPEIINIAKITGAWCKGSPPGGTFVPLDKIGLNYDRSYFTAGN